MKEWFPTYSISNDVLDNFLKQTDHKYLHWLMDDMRNAVMDHATLGDSLRWRLVLTVYKEEKP